MADDSIKLTIEAILNDKDFQAGLKRMSSEGEKHGKKASTSFEGLKNTFKNIQTNIVSVVGAFYAAGKAIGSVVSSFVEADQSQRQLEARLKSTNNAIGMTSKELIELSTNLQNVTTFGDEAVLSAENMLLTFTKIGSDVFPQATEAVLDMATALGGDAASNAKLLGKALNDPTEGLTALRRAGVQMTDAQQAQIQSLWDMGDAAGAQAIVLGVLSEKIGGSARAAAEGSGQIAQFGNKIDDLKEEVGAKLMPVISDFLKGLDMMPKGLKLALVGTSALVPVIGALTLAFGPWGIAIAAAGAGIAALVAHIGALEKADRDLVPTREQSIANAKKELEETQKLIAAKEKEIEQLKTADYSAYGVGLLSASKSTEKLKQATDALAAAKEKESAITKVLTERGVNLGKQQEKGNKSTKDSIGLTDKQKDSIQGLKDAYDDSDEAQLKYFERLKKDGVKSGELFGTALKLVEKKIQELKLALETAGNETVRYNGLTKDQIDILKSLDGTYDKTKKSTNELYLEYLALLTIVDSASEDFANVQAALEKLDLDAHNEKVAVSVSNWQGLAGVFSAMGTEDSAIVAAILNLAAMSEQLDITTEAANSNADAADRVASSWSSVASVVSLVTMILNRLSKGFDENGKALEEHGKSEGVRNFGVFLQDTSRLIDALVSGGIPGLIRAILELRDTLNNTADENGNGLADEEERRGLAGTESQRGTRSTASYQQEQKNKAAISTGAVVGGIFGAALVAGQTGIPSIKRRANGGDYRLGQMYQVEENGPELFAPFGNGRIYPTDFMSAFKGIPTATNIQGATYDNRRYETVENRNVINQNIQRMDDPIQFVNTLKRDYGIDVFGKSR